MKAGPSGKAALSLITFGSPAQALPVVKARMPAIAKIDFILLSPMSIRASSARSTEDAFDKRPCASGISDIGAVGPRLASRSQRNVVVLLPGILEVLVAQHPERPRHAAAGRMRHDHLVDIAALGGDEG